MLHIIKIRNKVILKNYISSITVKAVSMCWDYAGMSILRRNHTSFYVFGYQNGDRHDV